MQGVARTDLEALRARIAMLEKHPVLATEAPVSEMQGILATPHGALHEIFADAHRDAGAALGFALAHANTLTSQRRPAIIFLQLAGEAQEMGLPYGLGVKSLGLNPDYLIVVRAHDIVELLWAMEESIACNAVAAVVGDLAHPHKALDFTASRRLSMRAASAGTSAFFVRYTREREASAARFRWKVSPAPSRSVAFDPRAPGPPRWEVVLEKGRLGSKRRADGEGFLVDWTENGFVLADRSSGGAEGAGRTTALSGAQPAALGDRLPETG